MSTIYVLSHFDFLEKDKSDSARIQGGTSDTGMAEDDVETGTYLISEGIDLAVSADFLPTASVVEQTNAN
jgi:hypothetical protein